MNLSAAVKLDGRNELQRRLFDLVKERSFKKGQFKLASGGESDMFFDMKMTLLNPEGSNLAADLVIEKLRELDPDAVGGLVVGACPIVDGVVIKTHGTAKPINGFYVRKEPKGTGTNKVVEGVVKMGAKVVLVDDVTTQGGSVMKAVTAIRNEFDCDVRGVITIVDREQGAEGRLAKEGIPLYPIFRKSEFE